MPRPLHIAVLGAGLVGRRHLSLVGSSSRCTPAAVCDPDPRAAALARSHGVPHVRSLEQLLEARERGRIPALDGVVVATPNRDHVGSTLRLVEAGIPALVEKPVADSLEEAAHLARAAAAAGVPVLVGHHRRHSAALQVGRRLIEDGVLGDVVAVQGSATFRKPDEYFDAAPWRRSAGGGPILINMVHEVDDLRWLCGDIATVQATASHRVRGFEVEDTAAMTFTFASGALGSFLLSDAAASARSWELTSGENPAYPRQAGENCYEVAGTTGSLSLPTMRVRSYAGTPSWWEPLELRVEPVVPVDPLAAQLEHFCDVVAGTAPPLVTVADAARTLATTLALLEAAATGRTVTVDPPQLR